LDNAENYSANMNTHREGWLADTAPLVVLLGLLCSCATSDFKPYSGGQQDWPTAPGGFIDSKYAVPTYYGPPPRPYEVLGYLDATTAPIRRRGVVGYAANRAKELGGDAIVVLREGAEYRGTYHTGSAYTSSSANGYSYGNSFYGSGSATTTYSGNSFPMFAGRASVIIIKFKQ
jgi:hypothetical protein